MTMNQAEIYGCIISLRGRRDSMLLSSGSLIEKRFAARACFARRTNSAPTRFADKYDPAAQNDRMSNLRPFDLCRRGPFLTPAGVPSERFLLDGVADL